MRILFKAISHTIFCFLALRAANKTKGTLLIVCVAITATSSLSTAQTTQAPPVRFQKLVLKSGEILEDAVIFREDAASITFATEDGLLRVLKLDLPDDVAKQLNVDPKLALDQMERDRLNAIELAKRSRIASQASGIFKKYAVELTCYGSEGDELDGFFTTASQLTGYVTTVTPSVNALGGAGLGSRSSQQESVSLGRIFLKGVSKAEALQSKRPIWAVPIGTMEAKESNHSRYSGYTSRDLTIPVYTADKKEAFEYYSGR